MSHRSLRKRITGSAEAPRRAEGGWLDITQLASVEITSEAAGHPIEAALEENESSGWRAGTPGRQTLRLVFDQPQRLERIVLEIEEHSASRTQELAIEWVAENGTRQAIVRQRWNFSPSGSTRENEEYRVEVPDARSLDLVIDPDVSSPEAFASLRRFRIR